jgi:hypothetical protein
MPIEITVDESRNLTVLNCSGPLGPDELLTALTDYYQKNPTPKVLWDFRQASLDLKGPDIVRLARKGVELAKRYQHLRPGAKTAAVLARDPDFGLTRMYEAHTAGSPVTYYLCRSWEEAINWLED